MIQNVKVGIRWVKTCAFLKPLGTIMGTVEGVESGCFQEHYETV
jgi:hypothetical protein